MDISKSSLTRLSEMLEMDCSNMTKDDLERVLKAELDKSVDLINPKLIHLILDIIDSTSPSPTPLDQGFSELVDMIEADIALRAFLNDDGEQYQFETVFDDIAFLMVEQYEKLGRHKPSEVQLLRSASKKGQMALYLVIANVFCENLDEVMLGAVQGAYDYLVVAADLIDGTTGEDLEIQMELTTLHMNSIKQLIQYAALGKCSNLFELNRIAAMAAEKQERIVSYYEKALR